MSLSGVQAPVQPGDVLAEKYVVERVLGAGTMGVVVAAKHKQLGQRVALKFLRKEIAERPDVVARFLREATTGARIKGEHTARILDVGTMDGGLPYMVMEFLEGSDLHELLSQRGPLPIDDAVEYVVQACMAVAEAHAAGIIHRDLKPSNLFLTSRPDGSPLVKVLDFGISKVSTIADERTELTRTDDVIGSPMYMSPEHARSARAVDARSDVWSLGIILHQLLAGEPPFRGKSIGELLSAILVLPPNPLRAARADVPPALEAVVLKCLEKDPSARMPSACELARALAPWARDDTRVLISRVSRAASAPPLEATQTAPGASAASTADAGVGTSMGWQPGVLRPGRSRLMLGALILVLVTGAGFLSAHLLHARSAASTMAESASARPAASSLEIASTASAAPLEAPAQTAPEDTAPAPRAEPTPSAAPTGSEKANQGVQPARARMRTRPAPTPANTSAAAASNAVPAKKHDFRSLIDERH
jgi:serine/threonine-protein kinase